MKTPKKYSELLEIFWAYCSIIGSHTTPEGRKNRDNTIFRLDLNKNEQTKKEQPFLLEYGTRQSFTTTIGNFERIRGEMQRFMEGRTLFNPYTDWDKKTRTIY